MTATDLRPDHISTTIVPTASLTASEWDALYRICLVWFTGYGFEFFKEECEKSQFCILMRAGSMPEGEASPPVGFATLMREVDLVEGRRIGLFFSGHCFALKEYWGSSALIRGLLSLMAREMRRADPMISWYWHYSAIGYRSYRYMPMLFRRFLPKLGHETDPFDQALRDRVGLGVFGACYEPGSGLIDWDWDGYSLSDLSSEISDAKRGNDTIAVLDQLNPRWAEGVEILCQARLDPENLTKISARWMKAGG